MWEIKLMLIRLKNKSQTEIKYIQQDAIILCLKIKLLIYRGLFGKL